MKNIRNCIGSVMVSVLASSAVDGGFKLRSGQTKDYEIGIFLYQEISIIIIVHCSANK
jgi:hypothetical protein